MGDAPREPGQRPEDRPVDPDAVRRLERLPDPAAEATAPTAAARNVPRPARPAGRNNLVTTAGAVLVAVGGFVAMASVLVIAPSAGLDMAGIQLDGRQAAAVFLAIAAIYAVTGLLVMVRWPIARPLGLGVAVLALAIGLVQLPSAGIDGIPTIAVAAFVLYALGLGGNDFRGR
jgi:hypothetical protein